LLLALACVALVTGQTGTTDIAAAGTTATPAAGTTDAGAVGTTVAAAAGTTAGPAGTTVAAAAGTTAVAAAGTTAVAAAGTTAVAAAGTTAAAAAGTTAAAAAGTTASGAVGTTGVQYLAASSTAVSSTVYNVSGCTIPLGGAVSFTPNGACQAFTAISVPGLSLYHVTRLSATTLWSSLYTSATCAGTALVSPVLTNNVCGSFVVPLGGGATYTVNIKAAWTANSLTTSSTTGPLPSSAATTVVGLLPIVLALFAMVIFA